MRVPPMVGLLMMLAAVGVGLAQPADEPAPTLSASMLLGPEVMTGPHHRVDEAVTTDEFFHRFTVTSDYGQLSANGLSQLDVRIDEVRALAALDELSKTEVFLKAAGGAVVKVGRSAARVVTDPVDSARGLGSGIKRFGVNLGRMTKRTVGGLGNDTTPALDAAARDSAAENVANSVFGVSSAMRRWAQAVGTDPYTTNPVLRDALKDIGRVEAAGGLATRLAVPIPSLVGTTATVGDLVWGTDPEELRKLNEQRLRTLGVPDESAGAFFRNRGFTLTAQTRLAAALGAVPVPGSAAYVDAAAGAVGERDALFFVESAELLARVHGEAPVTAVLTDSDTLVAARGAVALVLLPADLLRSTGDTRALLTELDRRARAELSASQVELYVTGRVSERLHGDLRTLGWGVHERVPRRPSSGA